MLNGKNSILFFIFFTFLIQAQDKNDYCKQWKTELNKIQKTYQKIKFCKDQLLQADSLCKQKIHNNIGALLFFSRKMDSAIYHYDEAIKIGKKLKKSELIAHSLSQKAFLLIENNNKKDALLSLKQARKILNSYPNSSNWISYFSARAKLSDKNKEYNKAIACMDSAITLSERSEKPFDLSTIYNNRGVYYIRLSNYQNAAESLIKALAIKEEKKREAMTIGNTLYLIGICYIRLEQYEEAYSYFKKAITKSKQAKSEYLQLVSYIEMAVCKRKSKEADLSLKFTDSALTLSKKLKDNARLSQVYYEKAMLLLYHDKNFKEAENTFIKAYNTGEKSNQHMVTIRSDYGIIEFYLKTKQYEKVEKHLKNLEKKAFLIDVSYAKQKLYKYYSEYYENIEKPDLALKNLKKYHAIKDSISNQQVQTQVANLEKKYDTEKKELEIIKLNQEKEKQEKLTAEANLRQNLFLGFSILLALLLAFGSWVFLKLRKQQQQLTEAHHNLTEINQVKNRLFSIIAHDLRGMLLPFQRSGKILKYHIDKGNYERTIALSQELQKNSESLSTMLDNLLSWSLEQMNGYRLHPEQLSVANQLQEIVQGFEQQAIHKNTKIEVKYNTDVIIQFDKGAFHVIFRNLIGNALKYTEKGSIRIEFKKDFNTLICSVSDTGIGMTKEQLQHIFTLEDNKTTLGTQGEKGTGLGLNLVYRFVKMHKGIIKVSSEKRIGTRFDLSLPITESLNKQTEGVKPLSA